MTEQRQRREIHAIIRAPTREQLDLMLFKAERYAARTDMKPVDVLSVQQIPGGWEATISSHNWSPVKWFREQAKKLGSGVKERKKDRAMKKAIFGGSPAPQKSKVPVPLTFAGAEERLLTVEEAAAVSEKDRLFEKHSGPQLRMRLKAQKATLRAAADKAAIQERAGEYRELQAMEEAKAKAATKLGLTQEAIKKAKARRIGWVESQIRAAASIPVEAAKHRTEAAIGRALQRERSRTAEPTRLRMVEAVSREAIEREHRIAQQRVRQERARSGLKMQTAEAKLFEGVTMTPVTKRFVEYGPRYTPEGEAYFGETPRAPYAPKFGAKSLGAARATGLTAQQKLVIIDRFKSKEGDDVYREIYTFAAARVGKKAPSYEDFSEAALIKAPMMWQATVEEVTGAMQAAEPETGIGNLREIVDIATAGKGQKKKRRPTTLQQDITQIVEGRVPIKQLTAVVKQFKRHHHGKSEEIDAEIDTAVDPNDRGYLDFFKQAAEAKFPTEWQKCAEDVARLRRAQQPGLLEKEARL